MVMAQCEFLRTYATSRFSFQLPDYYTDLHENRSLFDLCMNTLNKLTFSFIAYLSFFIAFMFSPASSYVILLLY